MADQLVFFSDDTAYYYGEKIQHRGRMVLPSIIETKNKGWYAHSFGRFYKYTDDDSKIPD